MSQLLTYSTLTQDEACTRSIITRQSHFLSQHRSIQVLNVFRCLPVCLRVKWSIFCVRDCLLSKELLGDTIQSTHAIRIWVLLKYSSLTLKQLLPERLSYRKKQKM